MAPKLAASVDIEIGLGDGVVLKGRGLDAVLGGKIRLGSAPGETPRAQGTLNVTKGTFSAYGRELAIEQGTLRFTGPLNNPALAIVAMRRGQEVEAGVSVLGTALAPRVTLVSQPVVPDTEKLSWLVLGHGLSSVGQNETGALQAAAGALLAEGTNAGVQSKLANAFRVDTLSLGSAQSQDSLQRHVVTIGKRLSSRLYVTYEQELETASSAVFLFYNIGFD